MSIRFRCEHCEMELEVPDDAGGRRNKCPHCGNSNYVPAPVSEDELLDLAPVDEAEEQRLQREARQLLEHERAIIKELKREPHVPLKERQSITSEDLHHLVVNYCLDIHGGNIKRADKTIRELAEFGATATQAVNDFISGKAAEPALKPIPPRLLEGFLVQLREQVKRFQPE